MPDAVIVEAVRSASGRGRPSGSLNEVHPVELLAQVLEHLIDRSGIDPSIVDDIIVGCVSQSGEQSATPGRMAWLTAGFPVHVPATTIDRKCGSSQQAVHFAAQAIRSGEYDVVIAAGVESMSRVPMGSARGDADPFGPRVTQRFSPGLVSQGVAAELVAHTWRLSRRQLDEYAARSHELAVRAQEHGEFDRELVDIRTPAGVVDRDETTRPGTTADTLASLRPAFATDRARDRFPEIDWCITAGNSSQIVDGASALLLTSGEAAARLGLRPRARIHSMAVCGDDPLLMLTAPIPATRKVLDKAGLSLEEVDFFEVNEAFASVPLAWASELGLGLERVNARGGAIALGHPLGSSGTRLMTTLLHTLEDTDTRFGLQVMCEAGGMANATIIERLEEVGGR